MGMISISRMCPAALQRVRAWVRVLECVWVRASVYVCVCLYLRAYVLVCGTDCGMMLVGRGTQHHTTVCDR